MAVSTGSSSAPKGRKKQSGLGLDTCCKARRNIKSQRRTRFVGVRPVHGQSDALDNDKIHRRGIA